MNTFQQPSFRTIKAIAVFAVVLGTAAAIVGTPARKQRVVLDTDELARIVENEEDHVDATDLADWILQKKGDVRIVDLRSRTEFDSLHIPGAVNHSLVGLDSIVRRDETIVLYSDGGVHSAQAWFLLKARQFPRVYFLRGGFEEWESEVLFPRFSPQQLSDVEVRKRINVAVSFGGKAIVTGTKATAMSPRAGQRKKSPLKVPAIEHERDTFRRVC
ncbi:MAG TPA: rhodanese-like domain-containing protein [Bacteroidota bacterium]